MDTSLSLTLLIFSLLLLSSFPSSTLSAFRCNKNDYNVLLEIKNAFNNPYHLASWVRNTDCCDWYSLECDLKTNRVIQLTIFSGNISGQIPSQVGDLPYLENLMFHKLTNLTGSIPRSITKLKKLRFLDVSRNNLSGPVPDYLNQLQNLIELDLSFNQFSGSIPPGLSKLINLIGLHLDRNMLTGSIPDSFGQFTGSVPNLYLSHNQLSGSIPKSLGDLNFGTIDLSRNKLVGDASMLFNPNRSTDRIDLSRNLLEFDFSKLKFPKSLRNLDINHNKIFGRIPDLENLQFLNVSYNRLCGEIPNVGKLQSFDNSSFFHNRCLCGPPLMTCK